jgi:hypothetical protein
VCGGCGVCRVCGVCGMCMVCGVTFDIPHTALVATLDTYDFHLAKVHHKRHFY